MTILQLSYFHVICFGVETIRYFYTNIYQVRIQDQFNISENSLDIDFTAKNNLSLNLLVLELENIPNIEKILRNFPANNY